MGKDGTLKISPIYFWCGNQYSSDRTVSFESEVNDKDFMMRFSNESLHKGDVLKILKQIKIPIKFDNFVVISLAIDSILQDKLLRGHMSYSVSIKGEELIEEDISCSSLQNFISLTCLIPDDRTIELSIKLVCLRNCDKVVWNDFSKICISSISLSKSNANSPSVFHSSNHSISTNKFDCCATSMNGIEVILPMPIITDNKVSVSFHSTPPLPQFRSDSFWFEYPTLVSKSITNLDAWNIALGVIVSKLAELSVPSKIICTEPIPSGVAIFHKIYNRAPHVEITPVISGTSELDFFKNRNNDNLKNLSHRPALLFGGGKDSLANLGTLLEIKADVGLISYSYSFLGDPLASEKRREQFSAIEYVKKQGIDVDVIRTNIVQTLRRPLHMEIYTCSAMPILRQRGYGSIHFALELCHYFIGRNGSPDLSPMFRRSRPELNRLVSSHLQDNLNVNCNVSNLHLPISEFGAFLLLSSRYPELNKHVMMCESSYKTELKWCKSCTKCAEHVLFCLAADIKPEFCPNEFFSSSNWITKRVLPVLGLISNDKKRNWVEGLTFVGHIDSFRHVVAKVDASSFSNPVAKKNLLLLKESIGLLSPSEEMFIEPMSKDIEHPSLIPLFDIMKSELGVYNELPSKSWGNESVYFSPGFDCLIDENTDLVKNKLNERLDLSNGFEALTLMPFYFYSNQVSKTQINGNAVSLISSSIDEKLIKIKIERTCSSMINSKKYNQLNFSIFFPLGSTKCKILVKSPCMLENSLDAGINEITLNLPESVASSKLSFSCSYVPSSLPSKIEVGNFIINES